MVHRRVIVQALGRSVKLYQGKSQLNNAPVGEGVWTRQSGRDQGDTSVHILHILEIQKDDSSAEIMRWDSWGYFRLRTLKYASIFLVIHFVSISNQMYRNCCIPPVTQRLRISQRQRRKNCIAEISRIIIFMHVDGCDTRGFQILQEVCNKLLWLLSICWPRKISLNNKLIEVMILFLSLLFQ